MPSKSKDRLFQKKTSRVADFNFGKNTASVFDDMLSRSVPFYAETQRMIKEMAIEFAQPNTNIYDLGCSTCETFLYLKNSLPANVTFIGVDSSPEMLQKAKQKMHKANVKQKTELFCQDLNKEILVANASVVIMNLTLQFIRPLYRERVIKTIAKGLRPGGCLILIEKVLSHNSTINRLFIKFYYDFKKRNNYSQLEIAQKREALENVLIPYHFDENRELLLRNGFKGCDMFFRWYNFCGIVALK
jgi:tRNA (cmo5U34)-methyltransferase